MSVATTMSSEAGASPPSAAGAVPAGPRRRGSGRWRAAAQLLVLAAPLVAMVVAGWQLRWMSDDGFIHLRVVSQLVHGNGPVFNAGERVEASTSPLWVALLALAYPVSSLVLPWKAIVLGIALTALGLLAAERAAVTFARAAGRPAGARPLVLPVGALVVVALPPFWEFASSGLETGLVFAWLGTCTSLAARATAPPSPPPPSPALPAVTPPPTLATRARPLALVSAWRRPGAPWWPGARGVRPAHRRRARRLGRGRRGDVTDEVVEGAGDGDDPARIVLPDSAPVEPPPPRRRPGMRWRGQLAGGVVVGLGPLIRPDLAVFTAAFGLVLLIAAARRGWAAGLAFVGAVAALPVAYQVFRMGYFAMVVPNTAIAKEAGDSNWEQGRRYLSDLVDPYGLWVPLALLGLVLAVQVAGDLRARAWLRALARLAPAVAAVAHAAYVMRVGGDFMHARLLLPAVFAVAAPVGVTVRRPSWRFGTWVVGPAVVAGVCGWAIVCAVALRRDVSSPAPWGGVQPVTADGIIAEEREFYRTIRHLDPPIRLDRSLGAQLEDDERTWPRDGLAYVGETNEPLLERLPLSSAVDARAAQSAMSIGAASIAWGDDVYVIDTLSLAHPVGSHLDHTIGDRPGHQKPLPLVWRTAGLVEGQLPVRMADDERTIVLSRRHVAAAEEALDCGQLGRYLRGIRRPLTPARFLANIVDALPNTSLRVPPDPHTAARRLCR